MHRRRHFLASIAILSLLLSIAVVALWIRSLTTADQLNYSFPSRVNDRYARIDWSILSGYGFLVIGRARMMPPDEASADWLEQLDRETSYGWSFGVVDGYPFSWQGFFGGLRRIGFSSGVDRRKVTSHWTAVEV